MGKIEEAIRVARKFYEEKTFYHAMRVTALVTENNMIPECCMDTCVILAIMHDLLEDTEFDYEKDTEDNRWDTHLYQSLKIVARDKETQTYKEYLENIKANYLTYPEAYWVKMADIKDHLLQSETLTDELKKKYLENIPYLL